MTDIVDLLESIGLDIKYAGKNVGPNDVNVDCPYCDNVKHLAIHKDNGKVQCWKCGFDGIRPKPNLVSLLAMWMDVPIPVARNKLKRARGYAQPTPQEQHSSSLQYPENCRKFDNAVTTKEKRDRDIAYSYLKSRHITTYEISSYDLRFTPIGNEPYDGRILIPVTLGGLPVNWVGRDYTGRSGLRYKNAPSILTVIRMSSLLWGLDAFIQAKERHLRLVEGIFDAWALGRVAASVQKSKLSAAQLTLIRKAKPEAVSLIFDPATEKDRHVKTRALSAAHDISSYIPRIKLVELHGGDAAELGPTAVFRAETSTPWLRF